MSPQAESGAFIVFEGGEGSGKSTQIKLLADSLRTPEQEVVLTREPGGSPLAEQIRELLLGSQTGTVTAKTEALLFAAARADHVATVIRPALERGAIVLCDRYVDSSVAYQGVARDLGVDQVLEISSWATGGLNPGLTIVLDIDPAVGLARAAQVSTQPDRMESESLAFHEKVRQAFLDQLERDPSRYLRVDASGETAQIHEQILSASLALIGGDR